jgi:hypothetical protein
MRTPAALVVLLAASPALAWGDRGHEVVNEAAARALPREVPAVLRDNVARLTFLGPEPDRWRTSALEAMSRGLAPDHFIDLELAKGIDLEKPPAHRHDYAKVLVENGQQPDKVGFAPYRVVELCQRMEAAIVARALVDPRHPHAEELRRQCDENLLHVAGVLGHYVADLANPHHTTVHYNGWTGDNPEGFATDKGTHARFESDFVDRLGPRLSIDVTDVPVRGDLDYAREIWAFVRESNLLVRDLYRLDKRGAFAEGNEETDAGKGGEAFVERRMSRGAALLRDLWVTACRNGAERAAAEGLRLAVARALERAGLSGVRVEALPGTGRVQLRGRVQSPEAAREAEATARLAGAREVISRLEALY